MVVGISYYFYTIALETLAGYFSESGFVAERNNVGGVTFRKHDLFVEVSYDPEYYPKYSISIVVGIGKAAYDDWGGFTGVPVWSIIPNRSASSELLTQTFSDENGLRIILVKTKTMIFEPYIKLLWKEESTPIASRALIALPLV
jgi:hypothetical protein